MTYNPSEPRDPLGKWMKAHGGNPKASLADNVKNLNYAEEHGAAVDTKNTPTAVKTKESHIRFIADAAFCFSVPPVNLYAVQLFYWNVSPNGFLVRRADFSPLLSSKQKDIPPP